MNNKNFQILEMLKIFFRITIKRALSIYPRKILSDFLTSDFLDF